MTRAKAVFIALFAAVLLLPLLQMLFPFVNIQPLEEKRRLAAFPDIVTAYRHGDGRVAASVNQWFDDHVGFRPFLVRLKHQIDYSVFSYSDKVLIGRDGWLYDPRFLDAVVDDQRGGQVHAAQVEERFVALARYLTRRNIRLIVLAIPMKETVYPQFMPRAAPHIPAGTMYERLRAFLASRSEWLYIDGQSVLSQCGDYRFFHHHDIHTTPPAPYCYARLVVDRVAEAEHVASPWNLHFTFEPYTNYAGGLVDFLSLLTSRPSEGGFSPSKIYDTDHPPPEGFFEKRLPAGYQWIYHTREPFRAGKLPRTVVFGNSFSDHFLSAGMFQYFEDLYRGSGTGQELDLVLPSIPEGTRYFIYQFWQPLASDLLAPKTLESKE